MKVYANDISLRVLKCLSIDEIWMKPLVYFDDTKMKLNPSKCTFGVTTSKFIRFFVTKYGIEANLEKI